MKTTIIVSQHRSHHGEKPRFHCSEAINKTTPTKKPFMPFALGTVRGPYSCGKDMDAKGGVQFLVQTVNGWVPFIGNANNESDLRKQAHEFARQIIGKTNSI